MLAYVLVSALLAYYLLLHFDLLPLPATELLWNVFIFVMPSRIIFALDQADSHSNSSDEKSQVIRSRSHAAKSEAMRRVFGIDQGAFLATFHRARSFSGLSHVFSGPKRDVPAGLGNWDNSCYQNSVIQGFASLTCLDKFLENNLEELGGKADSRTHTALKSIIEKLNDPSNYGRRVWTPADLKSMSSWQQQDAQEYFSKVVDEMDKEIIRANRGRTNNPGLKISDERGPASLNTDLKEQGQPEKIRFQNPLEGLLAQRVGCLRCGWTEGLSLIPFNCLTVPLGRNWEYDVRDCLDEYTTLEPINGVECARCTLLRNREQLQRLLQQVDDGDSLQDRPEGPRLSQALRVSAQTRLDTVERVLDEEDFSEIALTKKCNIPARSRVSSTKTRQAAIARAPKALVIHVNRSLFDDLTGAQRKNYAAVQFPKTLNIGGWCLGSWSTDKSEAEVESWNTDPSKSMLPKIGAIPSENEKIYELCSVITHYGRHENGHYICYRKYPANHFSPAFEEFATGENEDRRLKTWYRLSDDDVTMVSESTVLAQGGVFMLFYEAIEEPSRPQSSQQMGNLPTTSVEDRVEPTHEPVETTPPNPSKVEEVSLDEEAITERDPTRSDLPMAKPDIPPQPSSAGIENFPQHNDSSANQTTQQQQPQPPRVTSPIPTSVTLSDSDSPPPQTPRTPPFVHPGVATVMRTAGPPPDNSNKNKDGRKRKHSRNLLDSSPSMVTAV